MTMTTTARIVSALDANTVTSLSSLNAWAMGMLDADAESKGRDYMTSSSLMEHETNLILGNGFSLADYRMASRVGLKFSVNRKVRAFIWAAVTAQTLLAQRRRAI